MSTPEILWNHVRGPADIKYVGSFIRKLDVNGHEGPINGRDGHPMFRLGYQDDAGQVTWKAAIWLQAHEFTTEVHQRIVSGVGEEAMTEKDIRDWNEFVDAKDRLRAAIAAAVLEDWAALKSWLRRITRP